MLSVLKYDLKSVLLVSGSSPNLEVHQRGIGELLCYRNLGWLLHCYFHSQFAESNNPFNSHRFEQLSALSCKLKEQL